MTHEFSVDVAVVSEAVHVYPSKQGRKLYPFISSHHIMLSHILAKHSKGTLNS